MSNCFHSLGASQDVREFVAVELRPHEPLMLRSAGFGGDHYYNWRPPANYAPQGKCLAELLSYFDNAKDQISRALIAAAFLTPFWGGPYGKRPAFVCTAPDKRRKCPRAPISPTESR